VPTVLKYESLILLEPSEPVQACNGIALPLSLSPSLITAYSVQRLVSSAVTTNDYQFSFAYRTLNFNVTETDKLVFGASRRFVFVSEYNLPHFGFVSWFTGTKDVTVANLIHIIVS
jgi:hypothetical protein